MTTIQLPETAYLYTVDALAEAWPVRAYVPGFGGVVASSPAFVPSSDTSESRAMFAMHKARQRLQVFGSDPIHYPALSHLMKRSSVA